MPHLEGPVMGGRMVLGEGCTTSSVPAPFCLPSCYSWRQHFGQDVDRLESMHPSAHMAQTGRLVGSGLLLFAIAAITDYLYI